MNYEMEIYQKVGLDHYKLNIWPGDELKSLG